MIQFNLKKTFVLLFTSIVLVNCNGGDEDDIPQNEIPKLSTKEVLAISTNSATSGGIIHSDGGATILSKGVCWSLSPNPTIGVDASTSDGASTASFTSELTGLEPNTVYYVRAYATNEVGTGYGNEFSFSTEEEVPPDVYVGNVYLRTQKDVDDFGSKKYKHVTGLMQIGEDGFNGVWYSDITNIDALNTLESTYSLLLVRNDKLEDINALSNLKLVKSVFHIIRNHRLTNLDGLSGLTSVGILTISLNDALADISGLSGLTTIGTILSVDYNESLVDLYGLHNIKSIGEVEIPNNNLLDNGMTIVGNNKLRNIDALNNLTSLHGELQISSNPLLTDLRGLSNLSSIEGNLWISGNNALETLNGLENVSNFGGLKFIVLRNTVLTDFCSIQVPIIEDFDGLYEVVENAYNPALENLLEGNCSL